MKKNLFYLLGAVVLCSLFSCSDDDNNGENNQTTLLINQEEYYYIGAGCGLRSEYERENSEGDIIKVKGSSSFIIQGLSTEGVDYNSHWIFQFKADWIDTNSAKPGDKLSNFNVEGFTTSINYVVCEWLSGDVTISKINNNEITLVFKDFKFEQTSTNTGIDTYYVINGTVTFEIDTNV